MPATETSLLPPVTLVLGGARSGKSMHAESLVMAAGAGLYLATAEARDHEMAERIRAHQERRGAAWATVEEPLEVAAALARHAEPGRPVLLDCLTLWLSNLMEAGRDTHAETDGLVAVLGDLSAPVVVVSNEVGLGVVPDNAAARAFVDAAGRLNQAVAGAADRIVFLAAGQAVVLREVRT